LKAHSFSWEIGTTALTSLSECFKLTKPGMISLPKAPAIRPTTIQLIIPTLSFLLFLDASLFPNVYPFGGRVNLPGASVANGVSYEGGLGASWARRLAC
jgi:hypothetical protein